MFITQFIRHHLQRFGYRIFNSSNLPTGVDFKRDIRRLSPQSEIRLIFDVGANIGQTILQMHTLFTGAHIYAFEPVRETFETLKTNTKNIPNLTLNKLAFGDVPGEIEIELNINNQINSLHSRASSDR